MQSQAFKHCTVVTIAHRIQSVIDADMIIMLSDGCLVEQGPPWQLVEDVSSTKCTSCIIVHYARTVVYVLLRLRLSVTLLRLSAVSLLQYQCNSDSDAHNG
jgi:ABC-type multidrug transport system ATPase subunit